MDRCRQLKKEHNDCWVNTHISENPSEIRTAHFHFPGCNDYTHVHEQHGLLGPKFVAGHGVWLSNDELRRFSKAGAAIAFCPLSNLFLGSGLFRLGRATDPDHPVRITVGCDMGGGNAFTLIRVLEEAYKVGLCNNTMLDGSVNPREQDLAEADRNKLSPYRAFYLATLGGARALYLDDILGSFHKGKEADFVVLDWNAGQLAMRWRQSLIVEDAGPETIEQAAQLLFGVMTVGDDRNIDETWVAGKRAYKKSAEAVSHVSSGPSRSARSSKPATGDRISQVKKSGMEVRSSRASAVVVQRVPAASVDWFMEWQRGVTGAAEGFAGYRGTDVYPPADGERDEWVVVIHFDDEKSLAGVAGLAGSGPVGGETAGAGRGLRAEGAAGRLRPLVRGPRSRPGGDAYALLEDGPGGAFSPCIPPSCCSRSFQGRTQSPWDWLWPC